MKSRWKVIENEVDRLTAWLVIYSFWLKPSLANYPWYKPMVELDTVLLDVLNQMNVLAKDRLAFTPG